MDNDSAISKALSGDDGSFKFNNVPAGAYRLTAQLPRGHKAATATDTSHLVTVAEGAPTTSLFNATAIVQIVDSVISGRTDTLDLANGVRVLVANPAGNGRIPLLVRIPDSQGGWDRTLAGPSFELSFASQTAANSTGTSSREAVNLLPLNISYALPVTTPVSIPKELATRVRVYMPGKDAPVLLSLQGTNSTIPNSLTGSSEPVRLGSLELGLGEVARMQFVVTAVTSICDDQFELKKISGFTGNQPLVLIHGVNLTQDDCDDVAAYHPETDTFAELISSLNLDATIKSTYALYTFRYPTHLGVAVASSGFASRYLSSLTEQGTKKVTIIAHSMGGLVARQLAKTSVSSISQVITLATPHAGTPVADNVPTFLNDQIRNCYNSAYLASGATLIPWGIVKFGTHFVNAGSQAISDLKTTSPLLISPEPNAVLFATLQGEIGIPVTAHPYVKLNSSYTASGCYLKSLGLAANDGLVPSASALPQWSPRKVGALKRDHSQMANTDASKVNDSYLGSILNYLIFPPTRGAPSLVLVSGNNQVGAAGKTLSNSIIVEARAADGTIIPNVGVRFTLEGTGGSVVPSTVSTNSQGRASISWTLGESAGIQHLIATIDGYGSATISAYAITTGGSGCPNFLPYTLGTSVNGTLTSASCTVVQPPDPARYYSQNYAAPTPASQAVQIRVTSFAFSPRATIHIEPSGWGFGFSAPLGSSTAVANALVAPGAFAARVVTSEPGAVGSYSFTTTAVASDVSGCTPWLLTSGVHTSQSISASDCVRSGVTYDRYVVGIPPEWTIEVTMSSTTLDSFLELYRNDDATLVIQDNNGGGGANAHLRFTSSSNASYSLHVRSANGAQLGQYTLSFALIAPASLRAEGVNSSSAAMVPPPR